MSSIEQILEGLGQEARLEEQEHELDAELAAYAAGALGDEALAALRAKATSDPELAARLEAHAPIGGARKAAIVAALQRTLATGTDAERAKQEPAPGQVHSLDAARSKRSGAPASRGRWTRAALVLAPALAAAAAVVLMLGRGEDELGAPLPTYSVEVRRAVSERRSVASTPAPLLTLDPERAPVLILRPEQQVGGSVRAHAFVRNPDGSLEAAAHHAEPDSGGAVRLELRDVQRLPPSGTLVVVVGRPELAEETSRLTAIATGEAASGPGWQRFELPYRVAAAEPPSP